MTSANNGAADLPTWFLQRETEMLDFLRGLVEQESMTRVPEATTRIAESLGDILAEDGAEVDFHRDPKWGASLRARFTFPNEGEVSGGDLLIVGHLDSVWPLGTLAHRPFYIEQGRAYGPGIFDMKAGVTAAVFALRALKDLGRRPKRNVTLLMTCDEETGSLFSRELVEEEGRRAIAALVLEPPIPGGALKTSRKGVGDFELTVRGRSAHAGNDPGAGISAITELAHQILVINRMADHKQGTTLNVGVVRGGVLANVIAAEAIAHIDMRFETTQEGKRIEDAMQQLKPMLEGARLEVCGGINRPPLVRTAEIGNLFEYARGLAAEIGFALSEGSVGGGSDGNFIAALGVPVLDGLGIDGAGAHAEDEHIIISDIPRRTSLVARLIETL